MNSRLQVDGEGTRNMKQFFSIRLLAIIICAFFARTALADELPGSGAPIDYWRPILDEPQETFWDFYFGYQVPSGNSQESFDDLAIFEIEAWSSLIYYETYFGGDFDIRGKWNSFILQGYDGTSSGYPLTMARVSAQYSQRFENGYGLRARFEPGLYTAFQGLSGSDFGFPFGLLGTFAYDEFWEWIFGLNVYPGFDRTIDPEIGVRYTHGDPRDAHLQAHLGYPETKLTISPYDSASFDFGARMWVWPEFQMDEDDARERLSYDESRIYAGFNWTRDKFTRFSLQLGYVFGRELEFEREAAPVDIDDGFMIRFGIGGLL